MKTLVLFVATALAPAAVAQNSNTNSAAPASRSRQTAPARPSDANSAPAAQDATKPAATKPAATPAQRRAAAASPAEAAQRRAVEDAFNTLVDGIRRADADAVMKLYWNSPRLTLFNNNGTVTKTWEQSRSNRESLYARVKDVKLDVRDVQVEMLGRDGAVVTALWDQSQTADGQPERATGRMTLVFRRAGAEWKIVHAHTSPDRPDPSRLPPSERPAAPPAAAPTP
jgi:ketosteroid isomerase-like protein